jgi:hypothetical protein
MNWRCFFGHSLDRVAPLYSRCAKCGQGFFTDYFESRARGRVVRFKVSQKELELAGYKPNVGGWVR